MSKYNSWTNDTKRSKDEREIRNKLEKEKKEQEEAEERKKEEQHRKEREERRKKKEESDKLILSLELENQKIVEQGQLGLEELKKDAERSRADIIDIISTVGKIIL